MIQRKQSLFLIGVIVCGVLMLIGKFATFSGVSGDFFLNAFGIDKISDGTNFQPTFSMSIASFVIALIFFPVLAIFMYKNRKLQQRLCYVIMALGGGLFIAVYYYISNISTYTNVEEALVTQYELGMVWPFVSIVLAFLAINGIKKDEDLIKSLDRLR